MRLPLIAAFVLLALAGTAQAAQTVDISADNAQADAAFQKEYGMSVSCPDKATVGVPFVCTYSNASGASAMLAALSMSDGSASVSAESSSSRQSGAQPADA